MNSWYQGDSFVTLEAYAFVADELVKILDAEIHAWFSGLDKVGAIREGYWFEDKIDVSLDQSQSSFGLFDVISTYTSSKTKATRELQVQFDGSTYKVPDIRLLGKCANGFVGFVERGAC